MKIRSGGYSSLVSISKEKIETLLKGEVKWKLEQDL